MNFTKAIEQATIKVLSKNNKNLVFGLEVTNVGSKIFEKFPNQVFETPVSELSSSGLAVGLATQGFKPQVVFGRIEFALLAFDQIFTQAGRWEFMFGGNYSCPVNFRIQIGRQWGNGPQHTANYHSIFLQSYGLDIFIPSTPEEAYQHTIFANKLKNPSVILEHRYLSQITQNFEKKENKIIPSFKIYEKEKKKKYLILTYGDSLIDSLKAQKFLSKQNIDVDVISFSYFPYKNRIDKKVFKLVEKYKEIIFIDSAPFQFGILSGISSMIAKNMKIKQKFYFLSPPNHPSPSAPFLAKNYYKNVKDIINFISILERKKKCYFKKLSFDEIMLWPKDDIGNLVP